jgi:hypothetical protein
LFHYVSPIHIRYNSTLYGPRKFQVLCHNLNVVLWTPTIQLYTYWIHITYCTNLPHTLTPSFIRYCRWNIQHIAHTRRHTISAHHLNTYKCLTTSSPEY